MVLIYSSLWSRRNLIVRLPETVDRAAKKKTDLIHQGQCTWIHVVISAFPWAKFAAV